jgi:hypothetical protein
MRHEIKRPGTVELHLGIVGARDTKVQWSRARAGG